MINPAEALDAVEQALGGCKKLLVAIKNSNDLDGRIAFLPQKTEETIQNAFEALAHIATLRQQVAELVAFRPITELTRDIKNEVIFICRIGGDGPIQDTFAGAYCGTGEYEPDWVDCFVNPSANVIPFRDVVEHYTHFCVVPTPPAADGGQGC